MSPVLRFRYRPGLGVLSLLFSLATGPHMYFLVPTDTFPSVYPRQIFPQGALSINL
jgi:hypothetical protein